MLTSTVNLYKAFNLDEKIFMPEAKNAKDAKNACADTALKGNLICLIQKNIQKLNPDRLRPAVLIVAGGSYAWVSPREQMPVAYKFLAAGFNCFLLDYTVPAPYPKQFVEASLAMRYIKDNADELGVEQGKITALGFSAGAHVVGCISNLFADKDILQTLNGLTCGDKKWRKEDLRPDLAVYCYPVITTNPDKRHELSTQYLCGGDEKLIKKMSLENAVNPQSPPAFIWHTYGDDSVPVYNSLALMCAYEKNKVPFTAHVYEKGGHGLSVANESTYNTNNAPVTDSALSGWTDLCISWLRDRGMKICD